MPFTPAHPAIILPLLKVSPRYVSATGLIIGSMAPDFEYFFKMAVDSEYSHTVAGIFYFDIPVTVFLAFVFHGVVKKGLIDNLPFFLQSRLWKARQFDFLQWVRSHYVVFLVSALAGSASHIFWDGFTHGDGYFVTHLSFYKGSYIPFDGVNYPLWYALQHISTATGLVIVILAVVFLRPGQVTPQKPSLAYWGGVAAIMAVMIMVRFRFNVDQAPLGNFIVSTITSFCAALVVLGLFYSRSTLNGPQTHG